MKIAIPILGFGCAGGYRVLARLATVWSQSGHEVLMLCDRHSRQPYFPASCRVLWIDHRGKQSEWRGPDDPAAPRGKIRVISQLVALNRALNNYCRCHDAILANHCLTAFPVRFCQSRAEKFYYIQAYEPEYYALQIGWSPRILRRLAALSYRLGLRQIVNSRFYCNHREIRTRHVVPPGLDENIFHPAATPRSCDPQRFTIGCIGRHEPNKGTRYVIDAFRLLADDSRFMLRVAYGNLPESCRNMPGLEVVVPTNDSELADFYRSVDVMVAPGTVQLGAYHYPVMEAMACGVPVITTGYAPATRENAWIVPVHDSRSIAEAIVEAADNPRLVEQKVSLALEAVKTFAWPVVAESMLEVFQEVRRAA